MPVEQTANYIFKVINAFQDSIPTAVKLQEWSQLQAPNQCPDDEEPIGLEVFEDLEKDVREIVTNFRGKTKDQIEVMLVQMNDAQYEHFQQKAEKALLAVNYLDLAQHYRECYPSEVQQQQAQKNEE